MQGSLHYGQLPGVEVDIHFSWQATLEKINVFHLSKSEVRVINISFSYVTFRINHSERTKSRVTKID